MDKRELIGLYATPTAAEPPGQTRSPLPPSAQWVVVGAGLVILAAGMHAAATLVNAVVLTALLAAVLVPLQRQVRQFGLPRWLATFVVSVPIVALGAAMVSFLTVSLNQIQAQLPFYADRLAAAVAQLSLSFWGDEHYLASLVDSFTIRPDQVLQPASAIVGGLLDASNNLFLMLFLLLYACEDAERLPGRLHAALGPNPPLVARVQRLEASLRDYMVINGVIGLIVALARTALLWAMGVDFALLWGVWSLLLTYVPTIGYPLAVVPPTLIAFLQYGWPSALLVMAGYGVINTVAYNVLMPRYQGKSLDLSPFVVVVSLIFWGIILGAMGALLAVPLTLVVRSVLESSDQTRWLADLMAGESSKLPGDAG
jgi:AI-2 transport protein TqsA